MNSFQRTDLLMKSLKQFAAFLKNLWGILAVLSVLFPIANGFFKIVPLRSTGENGVLAWYSPGLFTTIAVLISMTTILSIFRSRSSYVKQANLDRLHNSSLKSFGLGVTCLLIYLALYYFLLSNIQNNQLMDTHQLFAESLLLCLYSFSFALVTRGFALLATGEFFSR